MANDGTNDKLALRNIGRIIIFFGVFLLCVIWIGLYYKAQSERQLEINNAMKETSNLARAFEEHTLRTIKNADQAVLFLKYQYEREGRAINIPQYLSEGRLVGQPFIQLAIIDENGILAATNRVSYEPIALNDREHFLVHCNIDSTQLFISRPIQMRALNKLAIQMSRRINKPDGQFGGVAVVSVDPLYFTEFYKQVDLGKNSAIILVGRDRIVRARQSGENSDVGQDLSQFSIAADKLAQSSRGAYFAKSPVDGITRLYSYRALTEYPLIVAVGVDGAVVLSAVNQRIEGYYGVAGAVSLVILAFILMLIRIAKRQENTEAELRQARDILESEVQQRTQELTVANNELQQFNQGLEAEIAERVRIEEALHQKEEALQTSKEALSLAAKLAHLGSWEYNAATELFEFSDEFYAILGTSVAREGRFMSPALYAREFVHPDEAGVVATEIDRMSSGFNNQFMHCIVRRDGEVRTIAVRRNSVKNAAGQVVKHYGTIQDITEQVQAEAALREQAEKIRHMALFDSLTDLPNRANFNERLSKELEQARRDEAAGAVLFIDLDELKMVNDTYGHTYGDDIIIAAGNRIVAETGKEAFVARIGGDEFVVILPGTNDRQQVIGLVNRIITAIGQQYEIAGTYFHMTASIGIAAYPTDGDTNEELVKNADNAMYAAKREGKNCWRFYTASMQAAAYELVNLTHSFRNALERGELSLQYQPQLLVASGTAIGVEALLRWDSPEYGSVSPARFIPLAEQSGLIQTIGQWVLTEACRFARRLNDQGRKGFHVAVNISSKQLAAENFIAIVHSAIEEAGIEPHQLELEITESLLMESLEVATYKLAELKLLGVRLSLDDFGTGYSSLTYLRTLPVTTLKIDKSFVDVIETDASMASIIGSVIDMAHILDMMVVAEGVETEPQLNYLADKDCDCIQGYLFSRPLQEEETLTFFAEHS